MFNQFNNIQYTPVTGKRKKIMLLSDDIRFNSGVATMARELVLGTCHLYDWCQLAGAINHPEKQKAVDMGDHVKQLTGVENVYVRVYPVDNYGDEEILYTVMDIEKPDALIHFTDPRFWGWLYAIENQIRTKIPLTYYNIWDNLPYPMYNHPYYESCDALFSISKQTYNINKWVLGPSKCLTVNGHYNETGELIKY